MNLKMVNFCLLLFILSVIGIYPVAASSTVVWYLPHPDDETLGMADSIYQSVVAGNENYFIFFSKGSKSLSRLSLRYADNTLHKLTEAEFGQARVNETMAALNVLGVKSDQVLFFDFPDGSIPQDVVEDTMRFFARLYPHSIHCTVNEQDFHPDHKTLALALQNVAAEEDTHIHTEFYHVYIHDSDSIPDDINKKPILYPEIKQSALAEYSVWNPHNHRYAIGQTSTPTLFAAVRNSEYEYFDTGVIDTKRRSPITGRFTITNLDLGCFLSLSEQLSLEGMYDFSTSALLLGLNMELKDDVPLLDVNVSFGYHFSHKRPYTSVYLMTASNFCLKVQHIYQKETQFGIGIITPVF